MAIDKGSREVNGSRTCEQTKHCAHEYCVLAGRVSQNDETCLKIIRPMEISALHTTAARERKYCIWQRTLWIFAWGLLAAYRGLGKWDEKEHHQQNKKA
jgi:hypothetical protein